LLDLAGDLNTRYPKSRPRRVIDVVNTDATDFSGWAVEQGPRLIRFGYLLSGDQQIAQDLAQEALARVHTRWRRLSDGGNPDAYARAIVVNQLRSWQRRRWWTERSVTVIAAPGAVPPFDDAAADRMALWSLVVGLPEKMRAAVVLRFYEDLDDSAIGQILGCSAATVRVHVRKALAKLRSHPAAADLVTRRTL
jgi:RNA polymerase sigma-70 factor (sigma-E family)